MACAQQSERNGQLIAFEGVDGAGKSTVLKRVAARLRQQGRDVFLPRTGKEHDSRPTTMIRRLTRDQRNLDLSALGELLLYCAREAQVLQELVRPALARGATVLIDRSLLTPEVLGRARGLDADTCRRAADLSSAGLEPDITLVFEVDPKTSKLRKRVEKVRNHAVDSESGRKGLAGSAFKERVRALYISMASERGYPLFHVERATPEQLEARVMAVLSADGNLAQVAADGQGAVDRSPLWRVDSELGFDAALRTVPPSVGLCLSQGLRVGRELRRSSAEKYAALCAWAMDEEDPLRLQMADVEPSYALRGRRKAPFMGDDDLRIRLFAAAPGIALSALRYQTGPEIEALREANVDTEPDGVLRSIAGREDPFAIGLRARCWKRASDGARASSLGGCSGAEAWALRERLMEKNPVAGLGTLAGLMDPRIDAWLLRYADRAPKRVLSALSGRADDVAYELREGLFSTGAEVIGSLRYLSDPAASQLRRRAVSLWPAAVIQSLLGMSLGSSEDNLIRDCVEAGRGDLHVMRQVQAHSEWSLRPEWAIERVTDRAVGRTTTRATEERAES